MEERKSCWPLVLAGLLGLAVLGGLMNYTGKGSAKNLIEGTRSLAQEGLDTAGFTFVRAEAKGGVLRLSGTAPDKVAADAACKTATDKLAGRLGIPGIFSSVDCANITHPEMLASTNGQTARASEPPTAPTTVVPPANKAESDTCQARLTEAGRSGTVSFARNKEQILGGQDVLDRVAAVAKECQKFAIQIGGHTDTGGAAERNQSLSEVRAASVRRYLIRKGIVADQLTAKGFGETKPLVNDFPNGNADVPGQPDSPLRAQNRRIEFTITALQ